MARNERAQWAQLHIDGVALLADLAAGASLARLLDFSVARTGNLFFVPSATFLENIADDDPATGLLHQPAVAAPMPAPKRAGSLDIGSLKGDPAP